MDDLAIRALEAFRRGDIDPLRKLAQKSPSLVQGEIFDVILAMISGEHPEFALEIRRARGVHYKQSRSAILTQLDEDRRTARLMIRLGANNRGGRKWASKKAADEQGISEFTALNRFKRHRASVRRLARYHLNRTSEDRH